MKRCKTEEKLWFANYTTTQIHCGRTTDIKVFQRYRDVKEFMEDKYGYIIRQTDNGYRDGFMLKNTLVKYCNGFVPSASEAEDIETILK